MRQFKEMFTKDLTPFLDMLEQRTDMNTMEWLAMVHQIKSRVLLDPEQYLGNDMPSPQATATIVSEIFDEFVEAQMPMGEFV